jgi:hypothetical protein
MAYIVILSLQINSCFSFNVTTQQDLQLHEQLFADFFDQYKIQGNCPTVFVSWRKTELSRLFINRLINSYGSCFEPSSISTGGCNLKHRCSNQIVDTIEPITNLDNYLSMVSVIRQQSIN